MIIYDNFVYVFMIFMYVSIHHHYLSYQTELPGPHSLVHGDLRLTSLLLSAQTGAEMAPQLVLADLGLAGLPAAPPALQKAEMKMTPDWSLGGAFLFFDLLSYFFLIFVGFQ